MSVELEIPAFYVDAVVLDTLNSVAGVAWFEVFSRTPEPNETEVRTDLPLSFDLGTNYADTFNAIKIWATIGTGTETLIVDTAAAFVDSAWSSLQSSPTSYTTRFTLTPTSDLPSLTVIQLRIEGSTTGGQTLATSWSFTTEDLVAPTVASVQARDSLTVRVQFSEPVSDTALVASAYAFTRGNVYPQAAVGLTPVSVTRVLSDTVDVTVDLEQTNGAPYTVTVTGVEDLFGNVIAAPDNTADFTGLLCATWPADRSFELWGMIPRKNRDEDTGGELEAFLSCLQDVTNLLLCQVDGWTDILNPERAPEAFVDAMLDDLGNPFDFAADLTLQEKRRLLSVLVAAYQQKGTAAGIINLVRLFLGIDVTVVAYSGDSGNTWQMGVTELGVALLGGSGAADPYNFEIDSPVGLTTTERDTITTIAEYMKPAHTHLVQIVEPATTTVIDHVELGLSLLGTEWILH